MYGTLQVIVLVVVRHLNLPVGIFLPRLYLEQTVGHARPLEVIGMEGNFAEVLLNVLMIVQIIVLVVECLNAHNSFVTSPLFREAL